MHELSLLFLGGVKYELWKTTINYTKLALFDIFLFLKIQWHGENTCGKPRTQKKHQAPI